MNILRSQSVQSTTEKHCIHCILVGAPKAEESKALLN